MASILGSEIKDPEGKETFHTLWLLAACVLSLPHANVKPEHGFSINKSLLSIHGYSTKDETVVALRLVKDFIIERGRIEKIKFTQELLRLCERAKERWECFLNSRGK